MIAESPDEGDRNRVGAMEALIRRRLAARPVAGVPQIVLYTAHPGSRLARMPGQAAGRSPYWAFVWAGGAALARHVLDDPAPVRGLRVLDLGAGSGLVGIAAAKAGARCVLAADTDPMAVAAIRANAALNGVEIAAVGHDVTGGAVPQVDVVLAGDVFYSGKVASRMLAFLDRCAAAGRTVLVGDPGRIHLPRHRLRRIAEYAVEDFGRSGLAAAKPAGVFALDAGPDP